MHLHFRQQQVLFNEDIFFIVETSSPLKTKLYLVNAKRFKKIVDKVESRKVSPEKVAKRVCKIINRKKPPFTSNLNRNPLLLLLNLLPQKLQTKIIKLILK